MAELKETARDLVRSLDQTAKLLEQYLAEASAFAAEHGRNNTPGGMSGMQLRRILKSHVIAKLSPKAVFGMPDPVIQIENAPEHRRFAQAHPLPGLS